MCRSPSPTSLAKLGGADIPADRSVDGIDQREFLLGKQEKSAREFYPVFMASMGAPELYAIKWRDYKAHFVWQERKYDVPQKLALPRLIDLYDNPQERVEETIGESSIETRGWVLHTMFAELAKFQATLKKEPPVPIGASDPYTPGVGK